MAYRQKKFDLSLGQEKRNLFKQASKFLNLGILYNPGTRIAIKKGKLQ